MDKSYNLIKMSSPGWIRGPYSKIELQYFLYKQLCNQCRTEEGITHISDLVDMLGTACGCEFDYEEIDGKNR